jgi:hypothetical protein
MASVLSPLPGAPVVQAVELAQRLAPGLFGRDQRLLGGLRSGQRHPPGGRDLNRHQADAVGDDVVELARDPDPFLGHGELGASVLLDLQPTGPVEKGAGAEGDEQQRPDVVGRHVQGA